MAGNWYHIFIDISSLRFSGGKEGKKKKIDKQIEEVVCLLLLLSREEEKGEANDDY